MPKSSLFLVLRRLRAPLVALIAIYAISITGLVVIPGIDAHGHPARLDFLHAFYFISYTATTIGFGELPHPFTPAQRLWVTFCIYLTVIGWSFAFVKVLALLQDRWFLHALAAQRFTRSARRLPEPFYLLCGYGETGAILCRALDRLGYRIVVLDRDEHRIAELELADLRADVPALTADARQPEHLLASGMDTPHCIGVLAMTGDERTNLAIAASVRLLRPDLKLICRAETPEVVAEMRLFGVEDIIDPFETFAGHLRLAMRSPGSYQLLQWLTGLPGTSLTKETEPPRGLWVVHGEGHFASVVANALQRGGANVRLIGTAPTGSGDTPIATDPTVSGVVAGTGDDTRNLAIAMAARRAGPRPFTVVRQNRHSGHMLFAACRADLVVVEHEILAHECLARVSTPLLARFLTIVEARDDRWADAAVQHLCRTLSRTVPLIWSVELSANDAPACADWLRHAGGDLRMDHLLRDPGRRDRHLDCVPLLIARGAEDIELPSPETALRDEDRILFAGTEAARNHQSLLLANLNALTHVFSGESAASGWLWRWISGHRRPAPDS